MKTALSIVRRDLIRFARSPSKTLVLFSIPLALAFIMSLVFGTAGDPAEISIRVLVFDEDEGFLSLLLQGAGGDSRMDERIELVQVKEEGFAMMEQGEASALLHIPKGFTSDFLQGKRTALRVIKNPSERFLPQAVEEGAGIAAAILSQASRVFRPELEAMHSFADSEDFPMDFAVAALGVSINRKMRSLERFLFPPILEVKSVSLEAGTVENPETEEKELPILALFLPGLSMMGILFLAQAATRDIPHDRATGMMRLLLTTPLSAGEYLLGKCISLVLVTMLGFGMLILVGLAAGVDWGDPLTLVLLVFASSIAAGGTLLFITSLARTERQSDTWTTLVIVLWAMLGGSFIPLAQMPSFMLPLSRTTLTYWATDGFNRLVLHAGGLPDVAAHLLILAGAGVLLLILGAGILKRTISEGRV